VQIIPADLALPGQAPAQQPQLQLGDTELFPARPRTLGRDNDPMDGHRTSFSGSSVGDVGPVERRLESPQSTRQSTLAQVVQQPQPAQQQVARAAPEALPSQSEPAGGYVLQLSSFRSQSDALNEYQRLVQRHPNLVGNLQSRVQEASLGQSGTFYRLGVGPIADRNSATRLCDQLIAAGEKDCLVRRN
jgi:cell division septation protein DedD